ncbi:hypothetical protein FOCC_FOCC012724 [Frankliniella occidentalis]|nr:hypothetical protein FOCC_FOCC012724 [Frankliniella occidentalis]
MLLLLLLKITEMGSFLPFLYHLKEICQLHSATKTVPNVPVHDTCLNPTGVVTGCSVLKDNIEIPIKCCGRVFMKRQNYSKHIKSLDHQGLVACMNCHVILKKEDLIKHKTEVHQMNGEKWACKVQLNIFLSLQRFRGPSNETWYASLSFQILPLLMQPEFAKCKLET